jgi:6-phosphogluconate dehydrogenase
VDKAGQGTGKWTVGHAIEMGVPLSTTAAVEARIISSMKEERVAASQQLPKPVNVCRRKTPAH